MRLRNKRIILIVTFICFVLIISLVYMFLSVDEEAPVGVVKRENIGDQINVDRVVELPRPVIVSTEEAVGQVADPERRRDDRIYVVSEEGDEESDEAVPVRETLRTTPRLVRLFSGRTAGYRIDQNEDGMWDVRVVEQGRGNRYTISTIPYSLNLISPGEFTKVHEGHIFSCLLYTSPSPRD